MVVVVAIVAAAVVDVAAAVFFFTLGRLHISKFRCHAIDRRQRTVRSSYQCAPDHVFMSSQSLKTKQHFSH